MSELDILRGRDSDAECDADGNNQESIRSGTVVRSYGHTNCPCKRKKNSLGCPGPLSSLGAASIALLPWLLVSGERTRRESYSR